MTKFVADAKESDPTRAIILALVEQVTAERKKTARLALATREFLNTALDTVRITDIVTAESVESVIELVQLAKNLDSVLDEIDP